MKITGELLKSERVNQGLSVQNVSNALKLTSKIINAIEAGNTSSLPSKTFVRGFVKSYAEFLKLDPDAVLRQFQEEMGSTIPLPKVPPPMPSENREFIRAPKPSPRQTSQNYSQNKAASTASIKQQNLEEQHLNNKILMVLIGAIVLVAVIVVGNKLFDSSSEPVLPSSALADSETTNVIIPSFENIDPTNLEVASTNATTSSATSSATITNANSADLTAPMLISDEEMTPSAAKPVELMLEPKKDIEIYFAKGNSKNFKPLKLLANKLQIIRSATGLHIKANDGGAFKIVVNGVDLGNAGPNNKPVKLSF
jgi:cytoskeleton protein RodZ